MTQDKTNKVSNVPPLRFPEFTGEWEKCTLGEIMSYSKDRVPSNTLTDDNYVSTENMLPHFGGIYRAPNVPSNGNAIAYQKGDTLLSNIRPYLKKVWLANNNGGCSADVFVLKSVNEKCNSDFLYYLVANDNFINYVMNGAKGVKMPRGDKEQIKKYQLSIPSKNEQCKITDLLSKLDQRISTQIRVIDKLESLIKGIYQKVFESSDANYLPLAQLCTIQKGEQVNSEGLTETGDYYVMNGGITPSGYYSRYNSVADTISVSEGGNSCGYVQYNTECFWSGGHCYTLIDVNQSISKCYLYHYLKYKEKEIMALRIGSGLPNIQKKDLSKFPILILPLSEQQCVANLLQLIAEKIKVEKDNLNHLSQQKAYLLQNMFI